MVVTGDFITAGKWSDEIRRQVLDEFEALRKCLGLKAEQIIAVPGNHDVVRYPQGSGVSAAKMAVGNQTDYQHERHFRTFVEDLTGRHWKKPLNYVCCVSLESADILVCVLNSCSIVATEWTEYGYVGDGGLDALKELQQQNIERPTFKMMALHHHLLPVTSVALPDSRGVTLSLDAIELLDAAQSAGVQIAVHGHQHSPRLARYQTIPFIGGCESQPLLVLSNGSTGVAESRRPGSDRNTYCLLQFDGEGAHIWMRELRNDCKVGATLFDGCSDIAPGLP